MQFIPTSPHIWMDKVQVVINLILKELKRLRNDLLTEKELMQTKELIKGNFLLAMESTDNRMTKLAKNEIIFGEYIQPEDVIASIDAVSAEDIMTLACEIFNPDTISLVAMGKIAEKDFSLEWYEG
jgi:predicted Zn-dependent peptidase